MIQNPGAAAGASGGPRGIIVDRRGGAKANDAAWVVRDGNFGAPGWLTQIDLSKLPAPKNMDLSVDGSGFPSVQLGGSGTIAVGLDRGQNLYAVSQVGSLVTRVAVDNKGNIMAPDLNTPPNPKQQCPAGDRCLLKDNQSSTPQPFTTGDFSGFEGSTRSPPMGTYSFVVAGCDPNNTDWTEWWSVAWAGALPAGTSVSLRVRAGNSDPPDLLDQTWIPWTAPKTYTPMLLHRPLDLVDPIKGHDGYLQLEFTLSSVSSLLTPTLHHVEVAWKCLSL